MKVLVAGGAGFIGSHLCARLLAEGYEVLCVDNLLTGRTENVAHLRDIRFSLVQHDVTEPFRPAAVDYVFHLASPASPKDYQAYPIETLRAGAVGTFHLLDLARAAKARFLLASTSEVYGDPTVHPQPEDYWGNVNPVGPRSMYDEAKRFAEAITMAYHRHFGLNTGIARIFNTYGPAMREDDGRAIPTFIVQGLSGHPLTVHGDGLQTRSFCYVTDTVDGLFRLMTSTVHEPVNLGKPEEVTILELAKMVIELTGRKSTVALADRPKDDPGLRRPEISRARTVLEWEPTIPLQEGLRRTVDWFAGRA
jgi:dTDP-glucose 4,6-dehydratase